MTRLCDRRAQSIGGTEITNVLTIVDKRMLARERKPVFANTSLTEEFSMKVEALKGLLDIGECCRIDVVTPYKIAKFEKGREAFESFGRQKTFDCC
jgi:hypothetical protein